MEFYKLQFNSAIANSIANLAEAYSWLSQFIINHVYSRIHVFATFHYYI